MKEPQLDRSLEKECEEGEVDRSEIRSNRQVSSNSKASEGYVRDCFKKKDSKVEDDLLGTRSVPQNILIRAFAKAISCNTIVVHIVVELTLFDDTQGVHFNMEGLT